MTEPSEVSRSRVQYSRDHDAEHLQTSLLTECETLQHLLQEWEQRYPCDAGCLEAPEEECSRHGRTPQQLWEMVDRLRSENHFLSAEPSAQLISAPDLDALPVNAAIATVDLSPKLIALHDSDGRWEVCGSTAFSSSEELMHDFGPWVLLTPVQTASSAPKPITDHEVKPDPWATQEEWAESAAQVRRRAGIEPVQNITPSLDFDPTAKHQRWQRVAWALCAWDNSVDITESPIHEEWRHEAETKYGTQAKTALALSDILRIVQ